MTTEDRDIAEQPIGYLWVNPSDGCIRMPDGAEARHFHDHDYTDGLVEEASIRDVPLGWLAEAFCLVAEQHGPERWFLALSHDPHSHDLPDVRGGFVLAAHGSDTLDVVVEIDGLPPFYDEAFEAGIPNLLAPLLARWDAQLGNRGKPVEGPFSECVAVAVRVSTHGRRGADAVRIGEETSELLNAARRGPIDRQSARDLIAAGFAGALVGLPEGSWLDAKAAPYLLDQNREAWELAKDVAAFANTEGGLILFPHQPRSSAVPR